MRGGHCSTSQAKKENTDRLPDENAPNFKFKDFLDYAKSLKDYSIVILITATGPRNDCSLCTKVRNEFKIVSRSYKSTPELQKCKLFLGTIDFENEKEIFDNFKVSNAPVLIHFPPSGAPCNEDFMDFKKKGMLAEDIGKWIAGRTRIKINIKRPTLFGIPTSELKEYPSILFRAYRRLLFNTTTVAMAVTLLCYDMASGIIWSSIHDESFYGSGNGLDFFLKKLADGPVSQYGIERILVIVFYCLFAIGMHLSIHMASRKFSYQWTDTMGAVGIVLVLVSFSFLLMFLKYKFESYPFRLFL